MAGSGGAVRPRQGGRQGRGASSFCLDTAFQLLPATVQCVIAGFRGQYWVAGTMMGARSHVEVSEHSSMQGAELVDSQVCVPQALAAQLAAERAARRAAEVKVAMLADAVDEADELLTVRLSILAPSCEVPCCHR